MRSLVPFVAAVALIAVPAATSGIRAAGATDGTLAVKDGYGSVIINGPKDAAGNVTGARGALIGSVASGKVILTDPAEQNTDDLKVSGCEAKQVGDNQLVCSGTKIRYRVVGGRFKVKVTGDDIDLSAVGKGVVTLNGAGWTDQNNDGISDTDDGQYKLNDDPWKPMPDKKTFPLEG